MWGKPGQPSEKVLATIAAGTETEAARRERERRDKAGKDAKHLETFVNRMKQVRQNPESEFPPVANGKTLGPVVALAMTADNQEMVRHNRGGDKDTQGNDTKYTQEFRNNIQLVDLAIDNTLKSLKGKPDDESQRLATRLDKSGRALDHAEVRAVAQLLSTGQVKGRGDIRLGVVGMGNTDEGTPMPPNPPRCVGCYFKTLGVQLDEELSKAELNRDEDLKTLVMLVGQELERVKEGKQGNN